MHQERDINDPRWKSCRYATFSRDHFKCCLCGGTGKLECHHIVRWADNEKLRFVINNLITLCETCHETVTGREDMFREQFQKIVNLKKIEQQAKLGIKTKKYNKDGKQNKMKWRPENPFRRY